MNINQQREAVLKVSGNSSWRARVASMSDAQVIAIYIRLKSQQKL